MVRIAVKNHAFDLKFYSNFRNQRLKDHTRVIVFFLVIGVVICNWVYSIKFAYKSVKDVTRYISTTSPEDDKFDAASALKDPIEDY